FVPDPSNPTLVSDGFQGFNSVLAAATCAAWTCSSTQIQCKEAPLPAGSFDWRDAVIYWALVDRFYNGNGANDAPLADGRVQTAANWQGGDWAGLTQKIKSGYFTTLGVNTLWIA